jgi:hypothetical protein
MKATKKQIAEAHKRGIVPGVRCTSPFGTNFVTPPVEEWLRKPDGQVFTNEGLNIRTSDDEWAKPIVEPTRIDKILDGVNAISERLALLEASVAVIRSGATFMQQLEQDVAAIEAAKVPKFGDRVDCNGIEWKVACDWPSEQGYYRLAPSKCGSLNTCIAKRHEFTIIP